MSFSKDIKFLIVGLGLIGGSYAQALTDSGYEVGAIDTREEAIRFALEKGYVKHGCTEPNAQYIAQFDFIVFALYPKAFVKWIEDNQKFIKSGAVLTDVTGVKCSIVYKIQDILRYDLEFIGAHPMAGRETSGIENSRKEMFQGANYIVTPTEKNTQKAIAACKELGRLLGFNSISTLSPEKHDEMIGFLSQLTHCIAISLMVCKDTDELASYTGDSFRDLTRIAKINDEMWSELFALNKKQLLEQMDLFISKFEELRECISSDDREKVREMMRLSTLRRKNCENFANKKS